MTDSLFSAPPLRPPPGGLQRLRRALDARAVPARARYFSPRLAVAASLAVAGLIGASFYAHTARNEPQRAFERELRAAMAGLPRADQIVESGVVRDLPSSRADVRIIVAAPPANAQAPPPQ